ncbi:hypothetical protein B0T18DRAFT_485887 [Schizothecium vesticola]|uniref:histidine kinase n=1 Tax=Schizothecium vesticola TaxID=314040 RepID=A0AA40F593_9PEZI|nr:hypothetical protein B0T18DRAFT_485887 [Schizothecium vesticola]
MRMPTTTTLNHERRPQLRRMTASPARVSEPVRERETFKYDDLGISAPLSSPSPSFSPVHVLPPTTVTTPDPCLTAFAQLGLYRLEAAHSLVSLFDRTDQHIVAEAVRPDHSLPPSPTSPAYFTISSSPTAPAVACIPRTSSLSEHVLTGDPAAATIPGTPDGRLLPVSVVCDVHHDARFAHIIADETPAPPPQGPGVGGEKTARFYAGVPIRSPTGVNIGVYSVSDDRPRPGGLTGEQVQFAREMSQTGGAGEEGAGEEESSGGDEEQGGAVSPGLLSPRTAAERSTDEEGITDEDGKGACGVLGFATQRRASVKGDRVPAEHVGIMPESLMRMLLRRHKRGQIWNFDPDGSILDSPSPGIDAPAPIFGPMVWAERTTTTTRRDTLGIPGFGNNPLPSPTKAASSIQARRRRDLAAALQRSFPGAKSVAFFPLFDTQKRRWFAAGFVWTKRPTRTFSVEDELSYLRVFGLIAMAEVARLNTVAEDKAKTGILGSISHELRSPLHGVVGAVELLRTMGLAEGQEGVVRGIETSGRTLLDTIDHLLDYSRISNQLSRSRSERRGSMVRPGSGMRKGSLDSTSSSASSDMSVHLDELVEEVAESVLAGWSYRSRDDASFAAWNAQREGNSSRNTSVAKNKPCPAARPRPADVILDIEPGNWSFSIHPGAFRRIVMNLFGNSLKFTDAGFIRIRLFQKPDLGDDDGRDGQSRTVVLVVSDSGKGIGKDYLEHELFSPFSQEDPFAPGTGLGLSLVQQMATTLGGSINIISEVGQGTTVKVSLPLPVSKEPHAGDNTFKENVKALEGARVFLRGFCTDSQTQNGLADEEPKQRSQLQLMEDLCRDWLGVAVVEDGGVESLTPSDFIIWSHTPDEGDDGEAMREVHRGLKSPHIIIKQETSAGPMMVNCCHRGKAWFIGQPIGPRKLADALVASRARFHGGSGSLADGCDTAEVSLCSPGCGGTMSGPFSPLVAEGCADMLFESGKTNENFLPQALDVVMGSYNSVVETGDGNGDSLPFIMIVDDNQINIKMLAACMSKLNHPHRSAINGQEAFEMYIKSPADYRCILTDISMPVMTGLESTRRIRAFERKNKVEPVTIITLTGLSGPEIEHDAHVSGVDLFLTRPLTLQGLVDAFKMTGVVKAEEQEETKSKIGEADGHA